MKKIIVVIVILLAGSIGVLVYWYQQQLYTEAELHQKVTFVVEKGESFSTVAQRLQQAGVIKSATVFNVYGKMQRDLAAGMQAGEYVFEGKVTMIDVLAALQIGKFERKLTFLEGWRREQMAEYLAEVFDDSFGHAFLAATVDDEGKLFPDTYIVGSTTPQEVRDLLVATFDKKFSDTFDQKLVESGMSLNELLAIASIVEREVISSEDKKIVAGIMLKRFANNWPLEADATVQYAMATEECTVFTECTWWPHEITTEDLSIDSPYNTRKYPGIPPAPIANPGLVSIEAVLFPQESEYWFYLSDTDGTTHFAATLEQHNANIIQYLQK